MSQPSGPHITPSSALPGSAQPCIFITGAAAGIGRAIARRFVRQGWFAGLYDLDEEGVHALREELGAANCHAGRLDVSVAGDWSAQLKAFERATGGRIDMLVNNAGISVTRHFEDIPLDRHHRLLDVNVKGVLNGCYLALPYLLGTYGSRVVNLCSASALFGQPMLSSYSASKAAVRSLTEALDIEWARYGIRVVDVLPLFVDTGMVASGARKMGAVDALGLRLAPHDIAECIWRISQRRASRLPLHTTVGWQTRAFYWLSKLSPDCVNRRVTARMAGY